MISLQKANQIKAINHWRLFFQSLQFKSSSLIHLKNSSVDYLDIKILNVFLKCEIIDRALVS